MLSYYEFYRRVRMISNDDKVLNDFFNRFSSFHESNQDIFSKDAVYGMARLAWNIKQDEEYNWMLTHLGETANHIINQAVKVNPNYNINSGIQNALTKYGNVVDITVSEDMNTVKVFINSLLELEIDYNSFAQLIYRNVCFAWFDDGKI